jgi:alpha-beta hydrolase superfamily lysophospholipase
MSADQDGFTLDSFTAGDGYRWQLRRYAPAAAPRGRVVCLHGIQSHAGWYGASCSHLARAGFTVAFLDRRGSGVNGQARGDTPSWRRLVADVAEFLTAERARDAAALPTFLLAISWGGKPALAFALAPGLCRGSGLHWQSTAPATQTDLIDGLVLVTPGLCPRVRPRLGQRLRIVASRLVAPSRLFPIPLDDPELFTATPRWQQFIRDDPLSLRQATARFLVESARLDGYLRWVGGRVQQPVLLLLAGQDRIIDNAKTRAFVTHCTATPPEVIEYQEAHHTLEFEPEPEHYFSDLVCWLSRHATALSAQFRSID